MFNAEESVTHDVMRCGGHSTRTNPRNGEVAPRSRWGPHDSSGLYGGAWLTYNQATHLLQWTEGDSKYGKRSPLYNTCYKDLILDFPKVHLGIFHLKNNSFEELVTLFPRINHTGLAGQDWNELLDMPFKSLWCWKSWASVIRRRGVAITHKNRLWSVKSHDSISIKSSLSKFYYLRKKYYAGSAARNGSWHSTRRFAIPFPSRQQSRLGTYYLTFQQPAVVTSCAEVVCSWPRTIS